MGREKGGGKEVYPQIFADWRRFWRRSDTEFFLQGVSENGAGKYIA